MRRRLRALDDLGRAHPRWSETIVAALVGVAYFLAALTSLELVVGPAGVAVMWPAAGIGFVALALLPYRRWPATLAAIALALVGANLIAGLPAGATLALTGANLVESAVAATAMRWLTRGRPDLDHLRSVWSLVGVAVIVNGVTANLGAAAAKVSFGAPFPEAWTLWWIADGLGILAVGAATFGLLAERRTGWTTTRAAEAAALGIALAGAAAYAFLTPASEGGRTYPVILIMVVIAMRFGTSVTGAALLAVGLISAAGTAARLGPFGDPLVDTGQGLIQLEAFLAAITVVGLFVSALSAARRREQADLQRERDYTASLVSSIHDGICVVDLEGRLIDVNDRLCEITGFPRDELVGGSAPHPFDPDDQVPQVARAMESDLARGRRGEFDLELRHREGRRLQARLSAAPLHDPDGRLIGGVRVVRDVSAERAREAALRESERLHRTLVNAMTDAIVMHDATGAVTTANDVAARMLGIPPDRGAAPLPHDEVWDALREDGGPLGADEHPATLALRDGRPRLGVVMGVRSPSGEVTWVSASSEPLIAEGDHRPYAVVTRMRDITEVRRAQIERDRFFDLSLDLFCIVNAEGRIVRANPAFTTVLGWDAEELASRPIAEFAHPDDRAATLEAIERCLRGERVSAFPQRCLTRSGESRWLLWSGVLDPESRLMHATARDITERVAFEQALRQERDQWAALIASMQDGLVMLSPDGRIVDVNPRFSEMTGFLRSELIGRTAPFPYWPEEEHARLSAALNGYLTGEWTEIDVVFRRADGTRLPVIVAVARMSDSDGTVTGYVETVKDVTERERIDRMKDEFVSVISHELRTPLTAVNAALGILQEGVGEAGAVGGRMLDIAVANSDRLVRLINDVLDLERVSSGRETLDLAEADARALMDQAADLVRPLAQERAIEIAVDPPGGPPALWCDPDRVIQVLTNYLGNAVKFSDDAATVRVAFRREGAEGVFTVADRGRGIPEDQLEAVFDRFRQVDSSDRRRSGWRSAAASPICTPAGSGPRASRARARPSRWRSRPTRWAAAPPRGRARRC